MKLRRKMKESADAVLARVQDFTPEVGIIFGTGLSSLADEVEDATAIPYSDIPFFATPTVETHAGELICGRLGGRNVVAMRGRFHCYEGYSMEEVVHPVRVMHELGARTLIASNACGGMDPMFSVGDICTLEDHINLIGDNPLRGPNDEDLGPRFPDMSEPYDSHLIDLAESIALEHGIKTHRAVYVAVMGPNLETRAEYRFLRTIGAHLVGMSTVPEVIAARHLGMRCAAFSIITDSCLPDALEPVSVEEIIATAGRAEPKLNTIVKGLVERMSGAEM